MPASGLLVTVVGRLNVLRIISTSSSNKVLIKKVAKKQKQQQKTQVVHKTGVGKKSMYGQKQKNSHDRKKKKHNTRGVTKTKYKTKYKTHI